ncbi:MAG: hypothetical protein ACTHJP_06445 [Rhodanobacteraceae bacterium]
MSAHPEILNLRMLAGANRRGAERESVGVRASAGWNLRFGTTIALQLL